VIAIGRRVDALAPAQDFAPAAKGPGVAAGVRRRVGAPALAAAAACDCAKQRDHPEPGERAHNFVDVAAQAALRPQSSSSAP
jgi:hypothetical protein